MLTLMMVLYIHQVKMMITFLVKMMMTHHVSPSPPLVVQYSCMPAQALKQHVQKSNIHDY